ncbi:DUF6907 domain-containing protein [Streptomyces sp.]|uniref:DUF6907 domain-containing protein n=1 Tax=Streptomyces sp. TaxID=1931 RepID=UPI002F3EE73D
MTDHTVTIVTADHGPVTIPCPQWCTQATHVDGGARSDIHHTGPDILITAGSHRGPRELLTMTLTQWPYGLNAPGTDVHVAVHLADGKHAEYDTVGLETLVADLLEAAGRVRLMARRLGIENRPENGR